MQRLTPNPLLPKVVAAMQRIAPLELADRSWDNVGVLLEAPNVVSQTTNTRDKVFLTVDLTPGVAAEALQKGAQVIVAYHPVIFSGLKSLTLRDPKQAALMALVQSGCSVYCPHSALDAAVGGINDWLCDMLCASDAAESHSPIQVNEKDATGQTGIGRMRVMKAAMSLEAAIAAVKRGTGIGTVRLAVPEEKRGTALGDVAVKSFAVCAGSGTSVFRAIRGRMPDLLISGEMGHHDVLGWNQKGVTVILTEHTNSERGYLKAALQSRLGGELGGNVEILVSEVDGDPLVAV